MKLSQKKNCNGCRCAIESSRPYWVYCELQVPVKVDSVKYEAYPLEPCYKPRTNSEWLEARRLVFPR